MWCPICTQFVNRAEVSWFSVMAPELFPAGSLLTRCRAIPANANVKKGRKIPKQINTTWISTQLTEITSSSETMVCLSEILQGDEPCSGRQEWVYWEAFSPAPARRWGGDRDVTLRHCGSGCVAAPSRWDPTFDRSCFAGEGVGFCRMTASCFFSLGKPPFISTL